MPDRWSTVWARFVPAPARARLFEPVVADLASERASRLKRARTLLGRAIAHVRFAVAVADTALTCRRLDRRARAPFAPFFRRLGADVADTFRLLVRRPGFTAAAALTLALGVGANVVVFGYVNHLLLAPAPVADASGLVRVYGHTPDYAYDTVSFPTYRDLRDGVPNLDLAAHAQARVRIGEPVARDTRDVELVSGNYFRVLGLAPLHGRFIQPSDAAVEGSGGVVVVSEIYWRTRLASDRAAIGRSILVNAHPFEIVGIAPAGFRGTHGGETFDFWAPLSMHDRIRPSGRSYERRGWGWLQMIGRVDSRASDAAIRGHLDRIAADLHRQFDPPKTAATTYLMTPARLLDDSSRRDVMPALAATFAFTALLLIVTCANLAGLTQARLAKRSREVAIRVALGSSRAQIARLWFFESLAIAALGGLIGLVLARWTTIWLARVHLPAQLPQLPIEIPLDWRVVGYTVLVAFVSACLFGWAPAVRAARAQPVDALKDAAATATGGRHHAWSRRAAVVVQASVAVVLLVASLLLARSLLNKQLFDPGFRTDHLGLIAVDLVNEHIPEAEKRGLIAEAVTRMRQVPGVSDISVALIVPLGFSSERRGLRIPGYQPPAGVSRTPAVDFNIVDAGYFRTMAIPIVRGRAWTGTVPAREVVINETMARKFWNGRDPIDQPLELMSEGNFIVAGIARDISYYQIAEPPRPYIYFPDDVLLDFQPTFHARTSLPTEQLLPALTRALESVDPRVTSAAATTFEERRRVPLFGTRAVATTAIVFGALALMLTAVGLYGVVSTSVAQRTREIGVRMALGASAARMQASVVREALRLGAIGAAIGFAGAYAVARAMESWLFQIGAFDVLVYLAVAILIALVAVGGAWMPARRAAKIDPVIALRG